MSESKSSLEVKIPWNLESSVLETLSASSVEESAVNNFYLFLSCWKLLSKQVVVRTTNFTAKNYSRPKKKTENPHYKSFDESAIQFSQCSQDLGSPLYLWPLRAS